MSRGPNCTLQRSRRKSYSLLYYTASAPSMFTSVLAVVFFVIIFAFGCSPGLKLLHVTIETIRGTVPVKSLPLVFTRNSHSWNTTYGVCLYCLCPRGFYLGTPPSSHSRDVHLQARWIGYSQMTVGVSMNGGLPLNVGPAMSWWQLI